MAQSANSGQGPSVGRLGFGALSASKLRFGLHAMRLAGRRAFENPLVIFHGFAVLWGYGRSRYPLRKHHHTTAATASAAPQTTTMATAGLLSDTPSMPYRPPSIM